MTASLAAHINEASESVMTSGGDSNPSCRTSVLAENFFVSGFKTRIGFLWVFFLGGGDQTAELLNFQREENVPKPERAIVQVESSLFQDNLGCDQRSIFLVGRPDCLPYFSRAVLHILCEIKMCVQFFL